MKIKHLKGGWYVVTIEDNRDIIYEFTDLVKLLRVKEPTVRNYLKNLKAEGYEFKKGPNGRRYYTGEDVAMLREFVELKNQEGVFLKDAAKEVVAKYSHTAESYDMNDNTDEDTYDESFEDISDSKDIEVYQRQYNDLVNEFKSFKNQQNTFNQQLIDQLQKQGEFIQQQSQYINENLKKRDQQLVESLRETQETKKLIAASIENKKKWWEFWK